MNEKYSTLYKKLLNAVHPDKVSADLKEKATKLTALLNAARDKNDEGFIQRVWDLYSSGDLWTWDPDSYYGKRQEKAKEKETKKEKEFKIDPTILRYATTARDSNGYDRSKMGAWLNLSYSIRGAAAKAYLDLLFPAGESKGREGYVNAFYDRLARGKMSDAEFKEWLSGQSENAKKHGGKWDAVRKMANKIWDAK